MYPVDYPRFEVGPELGPEGGSPDQVLDIVESWRGSAAPQDDVIGDLAQRIATGEITEAQAYEVAVGLGIVGPRE